MIDVEAIGFVTDQVNPGAQFPEDHGRHLVGCAVCAIQGNPHAVKHGSERHGSLTKFDVAACRIIYSLGLAHMCRIHGYKGPCQFQLNCLFSFRGEFFSVGGEKLDTVIFKGVMGC
jgi:hypothetical protein